MLVFERSYPATMQFLASMAYAGSQAKQVMTCMLALLNLAKPTTLLTDLLLGSYLTAWDSLQRCYSSSRTYMTTPHVQCRQEKKGRAAGSRSPQASSKVM